MSGLATFLHITDVHLTRDGSPMRRDDAKVSIEAASEETRERALDLTLKKIAERLQADNVTLSGVLFCGDAQNKGAPGGHDQLFKMLIERFGSVGISPANIVATPGNHDVPKGSLPSSPERYEDFLRVWRDNGCITPWIDGIDDKASAAPAPQHALVDPAGLWAVFPLNSSNWSQSTLQMQADLKLKLEEAATKMADAVASDKAKVEEAFKQIVEPMLRNLLAVDMARISHEQAEALRSIIDSVGIPKRRPARLLMMHHHLIAPSIAEELRPFAEFSNLSYIRQYLREIQADVLLHGHKHVEALTYDYIFDPQAGPQSPPHRLATISGGTFADDEHLERVDLGHAMRLVRLSGLPGAPQIEVERIPLAVRGLALPEGQRVRGRLWKTNEAVDGGPVVIHGRDIDEVYARAVRAAAEEAKSAMLIVHLDQPDPAPKDDKLAPLPFPTSYPDPEGPSPEEAQIRMNKNLADDLVSWWQLRRSSLEDRIPYIHGTRLRRFGGQVDQIARLSALLNRNKTTSRGIATLIDPLRDFRATGDGEEFASFCLVQFRRRADAVGGEVLDCIGYYRAQEFKYWWPINVAELRSIQREIAANISCKPGRITTITGDARAVHMRSPTQVAVPVIDRWIDQAPDKIARLSLMLSRRAESHDAEIAEAWRNYLLNQIETVATFNPEGVAVAVNGLELLASCIEQFDSNGNEIARAATKLAKVNRGYEERGRDRGAFEDWAEDARELLQQLLQLTKACFEEAAS